VEEEVSRAIGAVSRKNYENKYESDDEDKLELWSIGGISRRMIASVKVGSAPRRVLQLEAQDLLQAKTFQSEGRHSTITAEELSDSRSD
jgi:hypothetical protein